jgi:hypothetical protein
MNASKTSNARREREAPSSGGVRKESLYERRRRWRAEYAIIAPPKPRRRLREARRWLDVLAVRCTNGRVCDRLPGARLLTFRESQKIHDDGLRHLEATAPELFKAARWIMWNDGNDNLGITLEQWKIEARRRVRRLGKIRVELQRAGST